MEHTTNTSTFIMREEHLWTTPKLVDYIENKDSLEMIYKQNSLISDLSLPQKTSSRVFKIVYSCIDGKWNKSERIYGEIIPSREETYEF